MTSKLWRAYQRIDRALVAAGFPATSPWWKSELERFLNSSKRRWVIRAGRRAGKSSTLCRLAVAQALAGDWSIPPGDIAVVAFVSVDRREASGRLHTIREILRAVGVAFDERADEIALRDRSVVFRVTTCSIESVGFTSIALFGDEVARWESRDNAANPAQEVMGSLRPTMATQLHAFEVLSSSPWGVDDYHASLFELGETDAQIISFAPTWQANPTITEERTHELEPDARVWSREYAAVPGASISPAFDFEDARDAFGRAPKSDVALHWCAIDPSSLLGNDSFAYSFGHTTHDGELVLTELGDFAANTIKTMGAVIQISMRCSQLGIRKVYGDHYEAGGLTSEFQKHNIEYRPIAWSESSKDAAFARLRAMMRERTLCLPESERAQRLYREMAGVRSRLSPSGRISYATNGLDHLSCLVTVAHALVNDELGGGTNPLFDGIARLVARGEFSGAGEFVTPNLPDPTAEKKWPTAEEIAAMPPLDEFMRSCGIEWPSAEPASNSARMAALLASLRAKVST